MKQVFLIILAALVIMGCSDDHEHDEESEELEPLVYTIYSDKTELFVEFKPLVVGDESRFAAHFTILGDLFLPITEGSVSLTLTGPNDNISITADAPSSPGIFRLAITPEKTGEYKLIFNIKTKDYTDQIIIEGIKVYENEEMAMQDQPKEEDSGNEIVYLKEQAWKVEFANREVKRETFLSTIRTTGQIITPPSDQAIISAKSSGVVTMKNTSFITGSSVYRGENLFTITGTGLNEHNINSEVLEARYNLEKARSDYERALDLVEDKIISEKEFLTIKNTYEIAESIYNTLSTNYTGSGVRVYSPISGFIVSLNVKQGQFVEAGQTLAVISKNSTIVLRADLSQKYIEMVDKIKSANFRTPDGKTYNTDDLNGRYIVLGKIVGQDSPLIPLTFEIDYREDFIPGTFVEVFLKTTRIPDALVIPVSALTEEQGVYYVFVQTGGESFEKREVTIEGSDGFSVRILSGLEEGERVVTKGAYQVKLASMSGSIPEHGHEH